MSQGVLVNAGPAWPHQQSRWLIALAGLCAVGGIAMFVVGAKLPGLALVAAALGLTLLVMPDVATLLVAFVIYTNAAVIAVRFHGVPHFAGAASVLLLGVPLFYQFVVLRKSIILLPAVPLIVAFVALRLVSTLVAQRQEVAIAATTTTLTEGLILYLLVTNVIRDIVVLRRIVWTLVVAGGFLGALTAAQQLEGDTRNNFGGFAQPDLNPGRFEIELTTQPRSAGPIGEKNYYAQFMLLLLPLALSRVVGERRGDLRLLAAVLAGLIAVGVAFTASRAAAVGFVVMLGAMLALRQIHWQSALLVAAAAFALLMSTPTFRERMIETSSLVGIVKRDPGVRGIDKSSQGRVTEMLAATLVFWENPVLGVGPANFPYHFLDKADALGFQVHAEERLAHCSYLELAAETGLFGLLAYLGILAVTIRELIRARRTTASLEARRLATAFLVMMIVFVATALFLSFAYERYYWFMLALAGASSHVALTAKAPMAQEAAP